jgi:hypothetical protein
MVAYRITSVGVRISLFHALSRNQEVNAERDVQLDPVQERCGARGKGNPMQCNGSDV